MQVVRTSVGHGVRLIAVGGDIRYESIQSLHVGNRIRKDIGMMNQELAVGLPCKIGSLMEEPHLTALRLDHMMLLSAWGEGVHACTHALT
ncbi:hypothetical protein SCA6_020259 [Theobroma cacao]